MSYVKGSWSTGVGAIDRGDLTPTRTTIRSMTKAAILQAPTSAVKATPTRVQLPKKTTPTRTTTSPTKTTTTSSGGGGGGGGVIDPWSSGSHQPQPPPPPPPKPQPPAPLAPRPTIPSGSGGGGGGGGGSVGPSPSSPATSWEGDIEDVVDLPDDDLIEPATPPTKPGLSTGAKIGIGLAAAAAALYFIVQE